MTRKFFKLSRRGKKKKNERTGSIEKRMALEFPAILEAKKQLKENNFFQNCKSSWKNK